MVNNRHENGNVEQTRELLKPCDKGIKMNCWEPFFIHSLRKQNVVINDQMVKDLILPYELARDITLHN
jgi:hypothetical protein